MSQIRVVLVEDHDLTRVGLRTALQQDDRISVVGEAAGGTKGLQLLQDIEPDVAIVDIGLPDIDGIELTRSFREFQEQRPRNETKVLILTMHDNEEAVLAAFAAGADSYCMKDISMDKLTEAVEASHGGNAWIDPAIARIVLKQAQHQIDEPQVGHGATTTIEGVDSEYQQLLDADPLTSRELEVLGLIVNGCSNAEIAEKLCITLGTVKTHVRNILNKLCASDRTQAAVRALRSGLIQ